MAKRGAGMAGAALFALVTVESGQLPVEASAVPTTSTLPSVSELQEWMMIPGGAPKLPAACNLSWPTKAWPPRIDAQAKSHALRQSDVPRGLREHPPSFATNAPDLDELAVGFPHAGFAEVSFSQGSGLGPGSTVDERVGRMSTPAAATAVYRADRDALFGSCQQYFPGPPLPRYQLAGDPTDLFAYSTGNETRGAAFSSIAIVGHRGRFVFDLSIGTYGYDPSPTPTTVAPPTSAPISTVLHSALARLGR
jgi:hypothetical protein